MDSYNSGRSGLTHWQVVVGFDNLQPATTSKCVSPNYSDLRFNRTKVFIESRAERGSQ